MRPATQNLFTIAISVTLVCSAAVSVEAWPGLKKSQPAAKKTFQEAVDSSKEEHPTAELLQTDRSANLTYALPKGWQATKNPFYAHDLLVKKSTEEKGSLIIADRESKGSLEKTAKALEDELSKQCDSFKLESNEMTKLASGVNCARIIHTGKVDDIEIRQVNYVMPYLKGKVLLVTGTVKKTDLAGMTVFEEFASSIEVRKKGLL